MMEGQRRDIHWYAYLFEYIPSGGGSHIHCNNNNNNVAPAHSIPISRQLWFVLRNSSFGCPWLPWLGSHPPTHSPTLNTMRMVMWAWLWCGDDGIIVMSCKVVGWLRCAAGWYPPEHHGSARWEWGASAVPCVVAAFIAIHVLQYNLLVIDVLRTCLWRFPPELTTDPTYSKCVSPHPNGCIHAGEPIKSANHLSNDDDDGPRAAWNLSSRRRGRSIKWTRAFWSHHQI